MFLKRQNGLENHFVKNIKPFLKKGNGAFDMVLQRVLIFKLMF